MCEKEEEKRKSVSVCVGERERELMNREKESDRERKGGENTSRTPVSGQSYLQRPLLLLFSHLIWYVSVCGHMMFMCIVCLRLCAGLCT